MNYLTDTCFGCQTTITPEIGRYYCADCVRKQLDDYKQELAAFDAFHAYADRVAKS